MYVLIIVLSVYTRPDNRFQKRSSNRSDKRSNVLVYILIIDLFM